MDNLSLKVGGGLTKSNLEELNLAVSQHAEGPGGARVNNPTPAEVKLPNSEVVVPSSGVVPTAISSSKPPTMSYRGTMEIDINVSSKGSKSPLGSPKGDLSADVGSSARASP
ncbi:hypothetical protein AAG906_020355 [Vitis piasezkii]